MCAYWDMEYNRPNFLSFWAMFCPFIPVLTPKIEIWNKFKKTPGDIILLHMCTINEDNMMHGSWDKARQTEFFVTLGHFLLFNLPNKLKNQNFEKMKKNHENIIILHLYTTNDDHMMYSSWDMERDRHNFLSFQEFFSLLLL